MPRRNGPGSPPSSTMIQPGATEKPIDGSAEHMDINKDSTTSNATDETYSYTGRSSSSSIGGNSSPEIGKTSLPKRLGQSLQPGADSLISASGQSVSSFVESARSATKAGGGKRAMAGFTLCKLNLSSDLLVGREEEKKALIDAFGRIREMKHDVTSFPELAMVHGHSGTGKTLLVQNTLSTITRKIYIEGKFDLKNRASAPYSADLAKQIMDSKDREEIKVTLYKALGDDSTVITSLIPSMMQLLGGDDNTSMGEEKLQGEQRSRHVSSPEDVNRLKYMLRILLRTIGKSLPLVVFFDDLQWAESESLQLIENLATDRENGSTLFIGTYRDSEVDEDHELMKVLDSIKKTRRTKGITDIHLGSLSNAEVNELVSSALRSTEEKTKTLSDIIDLKTSGNPFFVSQFLQVLNSEELLTYSFGAMKWTWDEAGIKAKMVTDNVADLMKEKLLGLSTKEQSVLQAAACLGCQFDQRTLSLASGRSEADLTDTLHKATDNGILRSVDDDAVYSFVHDQLQYAAFCLIPSEEHDVDQGRLGMSIIDNASSDELVGDLLLIAVDSANCDISSAGTSDGGKVKLASLNLKAGKQAIKSAAFAIASQHFEAGISLLDENAYSNNYRLALDLHIAAANSHFCNSNFDRCLQCLDLVLSRPLPIEDKMQAYLIRLNLLLVTNKHSEGMPLTQTCFAELGYTKFPKKITTHVVGKDLLKTKRLLKKYEGKIPDLFLCKDPNRIIAMSLLDVLACICYITGNPAFPLVVCRLVRWSVKYGLCGKSGSAFTWYGLVLCSMGDLKGGYEFGVISKAVHDR